MSQADLNFARAVTITLREECGPDPDATGLVDDPNDPGGLTKWGISQRAHPGLDIRALTRDQAVEIYRTEYWLHAHGPDLVWPLCAFVFDHAVTSGPEVSIGLLQRAAAADFPRDGLWGPKTAAAAAARSANDLFELCRSFNAQRIRYYFLNSRFYIFGEDWCARVAAVALRAGLLTPQIVEGA